MRVCYDQTVSVASGTARTVEGRSLAWTVDDVLLLDLDYYVPLFAAAPVDAGGFVTRLRMASMALLKRVQEPDGDVM